MTADPAIIPQRQRGGGLHTPPVGVFERLRETYATATLPDSTKWKERCLALQDVLQEAEDLHNPAVLGFEARTWLALRAMVSQWLYAKNDHALRAETGRIIADLFEMARRQRERGMLAQAAGEGS